MSATMIATSQTMRKRLASVGQGTTILSATVVAIMILLAVIGTAIAPFAPGQTDVLASSEGISATHWLGTDSLGRDILSRALSGARLSLLGPALVVGISVVAGTAVAMVAAWWGGAVDRMINRCLNVMFSVPGILVAVLAAAVFGTGFWAPVLALGIVYIPFVARVVRSVALVECARGYVESLQLAGASALRINLFHIAPNLLPIILAQTTFGFGAALADFAAVSFLGLGIQPPAAEWGVMVSEGRSELLNGAMMQSAVAGTLIVITVVAFNVLGAKMTERAGRQS